MCPKEKWNNHKSTSITIAPSPLWISRACPSSRPWLVYLPHSCSYAHRSNQLSCGHGGLDYCDSKHRYASCELLYISKKIFHSGGMAPSEWTRSVRAVRDTPVADSSAPSVNTTRCVVYCPPIAVALFLHVLSVSYLKRSLWHCTQLWQYVGMGSLGTRLHWDCNAMGDAANISPRIPSSCAQNAILSLLNIHIIPSRQIYVAIDNPLLVPSVTCLTTSSCLWNYVHAADNISHAENLQSNSCRCFSHLYKFRDGI